MEYIITAATGFIYTIIRNNNKNKQEEKKKKEKSEQQHMDSTIYYIFKTE